MTGGDGQEAKLPLEESVLPATEPRTERAVLRMKEALGRGSGSEAIRFYRDAVANGLIREDENELPWLRRAMGDEATEKLLIAYAKLPCFYCNNGVIPCEDCKGRGHDDERILCTKCLALGIDRCDFCGGSGWFTIDHVPRAFQLPVIMRRVVAAGREVDVLLTRNIPAISKSAPSEARKTGAKALLQVNRLLGVLENMAVAARQVEAQHAESAEIAHKAIAACEALGPKLKERACRLLAVLAEASKAEAASASRTASRRIANRRGEFYGRLAADRNFSGTLLRHPMLLGDESSATAGSEFPEEAGEPERAPAPDDV